MKNSDDILWYLNTIYQKNKFLTYDIVINVCKYVRIFILFWNLESDLILDKYEKYFSNQNLQIWIVPWKIKSEDANMMLIFLKKISQLKTICFW